MKIGLPAVISFRGSSSPAESSRYAMESAPLNPRDSEEDTKALDQTFHDNVAPGHPNKVVDQIAQIAPIASEAVVYRVYKRRWFGLVMLIIMNIVVSWGWLTFAPVANLTVAWFNLKSDSPVNWLSTVILFAYIVATPYVSL